MKNYQKKIFGLINFIIVHSAFGQDIHFSQFYEAPLYRNPAFAGIVNGDIRVQAIFRSQWNSFVNAYKTGSLNAEYKMPVGKGEDFVTCGFEAFYDRAGSADLSTTIFTPVFNYHKSLGNERNTYLSAAFMGGTAYGTSKLAVAGLTLTFARELGNDGIRVNAIAPGLILTDTIRAELPEVVKSRVKAMQCIDTDGAEQDIVQAMLFLISDKAKFITGETLRVTGGMAAGV